MNPLFAARKERALLGIRFALQFSLAFGLLIAALTSGSNGAPIGLVVCLAVASIFVYLGIRNFNNFQGVRDYATAQKILRFQVGILSKSGWVIARQRKLPAECRGSVVVFTKAGDLAFVIGLSGYWPARESLAGPEKVAEVLSRSGTPHIAVCLAAFVHGAEESFNYGVLAVSPDRFCAALDEAVESFREKQDRAFSSLVDRHSTDEERMANEAMVAQ